ncbi:MAG TPA: hypothetical protein P5542_03595 [Candidatus Syntrophosphaera sp.]|jgi:hypothetical protein|uniref:Uncharacterized protein n=1 Tax=Candidatus Syntrophosphaera thermopropionivorans TaxID=2593015 RepID=A0AC61QL45_9BACT|nr:hypothetical protein [Candidatus Syntrophosphaera thermopropionivorans]TDF74664.1 hypothetical protein E0946_00855 [Candidatus Syntrophosphaera thermopropionivorans]HQK57655.1 hypothetical protein [Candidatus Syntrophosphaera thermopropionivorans]HRR97773.1 hypothetical protein [Candidatus Syntrophosphaera sp.]
MYNPKIDLFLEKTGIDYLFCLLANLEAQRLSQLPAYVRQHFPDKIPVMAMNHVADNEVPDYFKEIEEATLKMAKEHLPYPEEEVELEEETYDDSGEHIEELADSTHRFYSEEEEEEEEIEETEEEEEESYEFEDDLDNFEDEEE